MNSADILLERLKFPLMGTMAQLAGVLVHVSALLLHHQRLFGDVRPPEFVAGRE